MRRALCALLALAGCAAEHKIPATPPAPPAAPVARSIERLPARTLAAWPGAAPRGFALEVRGVREADLASIDKIREDTRRLTGSSVGLSGVAIAEALLLPGFLSGSLVAGGLILAPLAVGLNTVEQRQHAAIVKALQEVELAGATRAALARRLPAPQGTAALQVIVLAYGLVPKHEGRREPLCLSLVADLVVRDGALELYRDTVYLAPWRRSADAPPPVCGEMAAFAAREGAALRNAALDYAQVLAAIARHRTSALPWKS